MKKVISVIITFTILVSAFSAGAVVHAASAEKTSGDYKYTANSGNAVITGYTGSEKEVIIPSDLDGNTVTALGEDLFNSNHNIEKVTIPDTITEIGNCAFFYCEKLSKVNIPDSVQRIMNFAFCGTKITEAVIPKSVTLIGADAFSNCLSLRKITIKAELNSVPYGICNCCENLEEVNLPDSIATVNQYAFSECKSLKSIKLPEKTERIDLTAFSDSGLEKFNIGKNISVIKGLIGAKKLSKITLDKDNNNYSIKNGILYSKDKTKLVFVPSLLNRKKLTVPENVKRIKSAAFCYNKKLEKVNLNKVHTIEGSNFRYCNITKIVIPKTVKSIDEGCFFGCDKLKSVKFKRTKPMYIWNYCFSECKKLKYAEYPVLKNKYCGEGIFDECPTLKKIKVKSGVKIVPWLTYGNKAFKEVIIPKSVKKIDKNLGYHYSGKKKIAVKGFTIKGKKNSTAQKYAKRNKFKYIELR